MKKVGIVGATGYTGVELLRLLAMHDGVEVTVVTSRANAGERVDAMFPNLRGFVDIEFTAPDEKSLFVCDLVFFATPNGIAMKYAPALLEQGVKVIDLAADYRIKDQAVWEQWYGMDHASPDLLSQAIYGLPEIHREKIKEAQLVANPGCYPTAVTLALLPLLESGILKDADIIADCKSGASGAGRGANVGTLLAEAGDNFKAYAATGHRHLPEISQTIKRILGEEADFTFIPHLLPIIRGIHATVYSSLDQQYDLYSLYAKRYENEPFVDVLPEGSHPETRSVKSSNMCRISPLRVGDKQRVVVLSVIDNLVKGAAGQAIQNMNLMLGFEETKALNAPALLP
ncbi:MAG: N-acetyl-gamma-glutamyl-phosphate reductase [Thiotrichaceae bacterium]|nr:N-acetyl-gamma-glutamyl-phosphate reductase [Thiotrichaceae bacterium]